jgi:hypothetical protein
MGVRVALGAVGLSVALAGGAACAQEVLLPTDLAGLTDAPLGSAALHRPEVAGRVVRLFDFEEQTTNPLPIPLQWVRAQNDPAVRIRPGFPIWNESSLDYVAPAVSGRGSVRLSVRGGSASLRLNPGVLPIFADGDYLVTALVRTEDLTHARAQLTVRMLDATSQPIENAVFSSPLVRTRNEWERVAVRLQGRFEDAAYLQIDLELLQPAVYLEEDEQSPLRVRPEDFAGSAWFDDVAVMQLPRIELQTESAGHCVVSPARPQIRALVQDLTNDELTARILIYDADGVLIDQTTRPVDRLREHMLWEPRVERYGWYRAGLEVFTPGGRVGSSYVDFVYLPEAPERSTRHGAGIHSAAADRSRLMLMLDTLPQSFHAALPDILNGLGATSITLPMWSADLKLEDLNAHLDRLVALVSELRRNWVQVTMSLPRLPRELATELRFDEESVVRGLAMTDLRVDRFLTGGLDRFGQHIDRWRVGMPGDVAFANDAQLAGDLTLVRDNIRQLAPGPRISLGWRADQRLPDLSSQATPPLSRFEIRMPLGLPGSSYADLMAQWRPDGTPLTSPSLTLEIEPGRTSQIGARGVADDLVRRAVEAWAVLDRDEDRLALQSPWGEPHAIHAQPGASPALAAWRTLLEQLPGRRVIATWDLGPGIRCLIFAPLGTESASAGGALAVWVDGSTAGQPQLRALLSLGDVGVIDVFGNRSTVKATEGEQPHYREHVIPLSSSPIFIDGIDPDLVRLQAALRLEPPRVQSLPGQHRHTLVLDNPGAMDLEAQMMVVSPGGFEPGQPTSNQSWSITPRRQNLSVRSGETARMPLDISFFRGMEAGPREMVVDMLLESLDQPTWVRMKTPMDLGLDFLKLDLILRLSPDGTDALVEVTFTNTGEEEIQVEATAFAQGYPRQRLPSITLRPGQTVTRMTPPFLEAGTQLAGQRISVSAMERETQARLNKSVMIPMR